ncbi:MAG: hypothetical protein EOP37_19570 [Rubrivivax sp.]|nr:MAG: hypothetical protein EOP37_19570 [Rubrivivax sp.]
MRWLSCVSLTTCWPAPQTWHVLPIYASRLLAVGSTSMLGACLSMSGLEGEAKYACSAPQGVTCQSVSGTYANASRSGATLIRPTWASPANQDRPATEKPAFDKPAIDKTGIETREAWDNGAPGNDRTNGAWRTQPRVLRLWTKAWEDADGDLWAQGYVYVQVSNGAWRIDHIRQLTRDRFARLRPPSPASSPTTEADPAPPAALFERLPQSQRTERPGRPERRVQPVRPELPADADRVDGVAPDPAIPFHRTARPTPAPFSSPFQSPEGRQVPRSK